MLDLSSPTARWHRVVVPNAGPGPRYAHVLALVAQRYLVTVGGNDGRQVRALRAIVEARVRRVISGTRPWLRVHGHTRTVVRVEET